MDTPWLTDTFRPLDTTEIQGAPHALPQKFNDWLPKFSGSKVITAKEHLNAFFATLEDNAASDHEDISLNLFVKSLKGELALWFKRFTDQSIKKWDDLITTFLKTRDTKTDLSSLVTSIYQIKKKENETLIKFNMRFQRTLGKIPSNVNPTDIVVLTFYLNVFDP